MKKNIKLLILLFLVSIISAQEKSDYWIHNTLLTSHIGFVTKQTYEVFYGQTVEAIEAWIKDKPIRVLN